MKKKKKKDIVIGINLLLNTKGLDMLDTYMNEIIAGVAIAILIIIYFLAKKPSKNKNEDIQIQELSHEEPIIEEPKKDEITEIKTTTDTTSKQTIQKKAQYINIDSLSGNEEGSFGVEEEQKKHSIKQTAKLVRNKKVVPPHSKITKENFKEFKGKRILVAEDNLINQKVISGLLANTGIELIMADDGQIALEILEEDKNFHFVLMDAHMPRVDGFEATRQIRKNPAYNHIIIVALSGDTASDDIKKMSDAGMEEHLEKPLRMDALYDVLYAYSGEQSSDTQTENLNMSELDIEEGLMICGDDKEFYKEILIQFKDTYANSAQHLEKLFKNANMQEASQYLLDISGIAANIGATNISEITQELRESIKNPKDSKYLELFKKYSTSLQALLEDIKTYI